MISKETAWLGTNYCAIKLYQKFGQKKKRKNPKEIANRMNDFFTNLTNDFRKVRSELLYVGVDSCLRKKIEQS